MYVHPGEYVEVVAADVGGDPGNPVTRTGPEDAVLKPPEGEESGAVKINESHIHLRGLTITGLHDPDAPKDPASYHPDKLISINSDAGGPDDYLEGLVVSPHALGNAGQALINSVLFKDSEIGGFKVIGPAGTKWIFDEDEGHNGEIVYLGTAPDNRRERGYDSYDRTRNVRVHHVDNSAGHLHSEFVDCKTGVEDVTIEYCMDGGRARSNDSYYTRAISMDGLGCTIRWNVFRDIHGSGIRIGPQSYLGDIDFVDSEPQTEYDRRIGTGHAIYGNVFTGCAHDAINFLRESRRPGRDTNPTQEDQRVFCGNLVDAHSDGDPTSECPGSVPTGEGIAHLGGDSPWGGDAPTKREAYGRSANDPNLELTVHGETVEGDSSFEIPVTVTNSGDPTAHVVVRLRIRDSVLTERKPLVPPNDERRITLPERELPAGEVSVMMNGQKHATVRVTGSA